MRKIYIFVGVLFVTSVILFIVTFVYLDWEKHDTYSYLINLDGHDVGSIEIDRYLTEDKLIYKSISRVPCYPMLANLKSRIVIDRRVGFESYLKEAFGEGAEETVHIERTSKGVSFLSIFDSAFAYLDDIPIKKETFVFEEGSPVTYLPLIENYNFRRGSTQGFNAITHFSGPLPPMKRFVTLTSVRDEYIKADSREMKTECLLLKIKNYPQGSIWVAKSDRSLIRLEIPQLGLRITRVFSQKEFKAKEYELKSDLYVERDSRFKNKNVQLAGTLTVPKSEGVFPGVLLVSNAGPYDRQDAGLFANIADYLTRRGLCTFRYDRRGLGSSGGDYSSSSNTDELEDMDAALEYMIGQKEVDPGRAVVLAHSKAALYALKSAFHNDRVKAIILAAPDLSLEDRSKADLDNLKRMAPRFKWSEDYLKLAMKSNLETWNKIRATTKSWISVLGKRCFTERLRGDLEEKPVVYIEKIKIPVLILQGKEDEAIPAEYASALDKALEESGNENHALIYFGYLGHFFGNKINDGIHRIHYEVDPKVLETIWEWLNKNTLQYAEAK